MATRGEFGSATLGAKQYSSTVGTSVTYGGDAVYATDANGNVNGLVSPSGGVMGLGASTFNGYGKSCAIPTRMVVAGNSYNTLTANGTGITAPQMYASLLAARFPTLTMSDVALASTSINGYWQTGFFTTLLANTDVVINANSGLNSLRNFGPGNNTLDDFRIAIDAFYSWAALPESSKVRIYNSSVQNPAVTFGGAWSAFTFGFAIGSCGLTTGVGATTTCTVNGDTVYVFYLRQSTGGGIINISIDGVQVGAVNTTMSYVPSVIGGTQWEPAVFKYTGLTSGNHTVLTSNVNATGSILMGVAGFNRNGVSGPTVLAGNCIRMTTTGYAATLTANDPASVSGVFSATWNPQWMYGDGGTQKWNDMQRQAVNACRNDGLSVKLIDLESQFIPTSFVGADNIHPTASGYQLIYGMFAQEINRLLNSQP